MDIFLKNLAYDVNNHIHRLEGFIIGDKIYKITELYLEKSNSFGVKLNINLNEHLKHITNAISFNLHNNFNFPKDIKTNYNGEKQFNEMIVSVTLELDYEYDHKEQKKIYMSENLKKN